MSMIGTMGFAKPKHGSKAGGSSQLKATLLNSISSFEKGSLKKPTAQKRSSHRETLLNSIGSFERGGSKKHAAQKRSPQYEALLNSISSFEKGGLKMPIAQNSELRYKSPEPSTLASGTTTRHSQPAPSHVNPMQGQSLSLPHKRPSGRSKDLRKAMSVDDTHQDQASSMTLDAVSARRSQSNSYTTRQRSSDPHFGGVPLLPVQEETSFISNSEQAINQRKSEPGSVVTFMQDVAEKREPEPINIARCSILEQESIPLVTLTTEKHCSRVRFMEPEPHPVVSFMPKAESPRNLKAPEPPSMPQPYTIVPAEVCKSEVNTKHVESIVLKQASGSFGFRIAGGLKDDSSEEGSFYVSQIMPGGAAQNDGRLRVGDQLLSVNGKSLDDATHSETVKMFQNANGTVTLLVCHIDQDYDTETPEPVQVSSQLKTHGIKIGSTDINYTAVGSAVTTISTNLANLVMPIRFLATLSSTSGEGQNILVATRQLAAKTSEVFSSVLTMSVDNMDELLKSAQEMSCTAKELLHLCAEATMDIPMQTTLTDKAKDMVRATATLVTSARSAAIQCQDTDLQTHIVAGARAAGLACKRLMACTRVLCPAMHNHLCQEQLIVACKQQVVTAERVVHFTKLLPLQAISNNEEAVRDLVAAGTALYSLNQTIRDDLQVADDFSYDEDCEAVFAASENLGNADAPDFINQVRQLEQASFFVTQSLQSLDMSIKDSGTENFKFAKALADVTSEMVLTAKMAVANPDDPSVKQNFYFIVADIVSITSIVAKFLPKLKAVVRLEAVFRHACDHSMKLIAASLGAGASNTNEASQEQLMLQCKTVSEQVSHLVQIVRVSMQLPSVARNILDLIYCSEAMLDLGTRLVRASREAVPTITDPDAILMLENCMEDVYFAVIELRRASNKTAKAVSQDLNPGVSPLPGQGNVHADDGDIDESSQEIHRDKEILEHTINECISRVSLASRDLTTAAAPTAQESDSTPTQSYFWSKVKFQLSSSLSAMLASTAFIINQVGGIHDGLQSQDVGAVEDLQRLIAPSSHSSLLSPVDVDQDTLQQISNSEDHRNIEKLEKLPFWCEEKTLQFCDEYPTGVDDIVLKLEKKDVDDVLEEAQRHKEESYSEWFRTVTERLQVFQFQKPTTKYIFKLEIFALILLRSVMGDGRTKKTLKGDLDSPENLFDVLSLDYQPKHIVTTLFAALLYHLHKANNPIVRDGAMNPSFYCSADGGVHPLHFVCHLGFTDIMRLMSGWCLDMSIPFIGNDRTALHFVCSSLIGCSDDKEAASFLLDRQPDLIKSMDTNRQTPLFAAIAAQKTGLVEHILCRDEYGQNAEDRHSTNDVEGDSALQSLLLCKDLQGDTPLHVAARFNNPVVIKKLLGESDKKRKLREELVIKNNEKGETPVHLAACHDSRCLEVMLPRGKGIRTGLLLYEEDENGQSPLDIAASSRQKKTFEHLWNLNKDCISENMLIKNAAKELVHYIEKAEKTGNWIIVSEYLKSVPKACIHSILDQSTTDCRHQSRQFSLNYMLEKKPTLSWFSPPGDDMDTSENMKSYEKAVENVLGAVVFGNQAVVGSVFDETCHLNQSCTLTSLLKSDLPVWGHPAIKGWIGNSFKQFGSYILLMFYFIYLIFLGSVFGALYLGANPNITDTDLAAQYTGTVSLTSRDIARICLECIVMIGCLLIIAESIYSLCKLNIYYFRLFSVFPRIAVLLFVVAVIISRICEHRLQWVFASLLFVSVVFVSMDFLIIFTYSNTYVIALWVIVRRDILRFLQVAIVLTIAFSGGLYFAFRAELPPPNITTSTVCLPTNNTESGVNITANCVPVAAVTVVHAQEIIPLDILLLRSVQTVSEGATIENYDIYNAYIIILYLVFVVIIVLLMLNTLIAQINDSYLKAQDEANNVAYYATARFLLVAYPICALLFRGASRDDRCGCKCSCLSVKNPEIIWIKSSNFGYYKNLPRCCIFLKNVGTFLAFTWKSIFGGTTFGYVAHRQSESTKNADWDQVNRKLDLLENGLQNLAEREREYLVDSDDESY